MSDKYALAYLNIDELAEEVPSNGDFIPFYDTSAGEFKKKDATEAGIVDATDATLTVTAAAHANRIITLNRAAGIAVTLPAATGTGNVFTFIVGTTITSNTTTIKAVSASDSYTGLALGVDTDVEGASGYTWNADAGDDTITMTGTTNGGVAGDRVEITDYATGVFNVQVYITQSGGSEVTPFSATVS